MSMMKTADSIQQHPVVLPRIDEAMADQLQSPVLPEDLVTEAIPGNLGCKSLDLPCGVTLLEQV